MADMHTNEWLFCLASLGFACLLLLLQCDFPLVKSAFGPPATLLETIFVWIIKPGFICAASIISALLGPLWHFLRHAFPEDSPASRPEAPAPVFLGTPQRRAWELYEDFVEEQRFRRGLETRESIRRSAEEKEAAYRQKCAAAMSDSLNRFIHGSEEKACQSFLKGRAEKREEQQKRNEAIAAQSLQPRTNSPPAAPKTATPYSHDGYTTALATLQSALSRSNTSQFSPGQSAIEADLIEKLPSWMKSSPKTVAHSTGRLDDGSGPVVQIPGLPRMRLDLYKQVYIPFPRLGEVMPATTEVSATMLAKAKLMTGRD